MSLDTSCCAQQQRWRGAAFTPCWSCFPGASNWPMHDTELDGPFLVRSDRAAALMFLKAPEVASHLCWSLSKSGAGQSLDSKSSGSPLYTVLSSLTEVRQDRNAAKYIQKLKIALSNEISLWNLSMMLQYYVRPRLCCNPRWERGGRHCIPVKKHEPSKGLFICIHECLSQGGDNYQTLCVTWWKMLLVWLSVGEPGSSLLFSTEGRRQRPDWSLMPKGSSQSLYNFNHASAHTRPQDN